MNLTLSQAFQQFNANPRNIRSSVSAFSPDGALVLSLWQHYFTRSDDGPCYSDHLSRWLGSPGNTWLKEDLEQAQRDNSPIKAIIAIASDPKLVNAGKDASQMKKEFFIPDWREGTLTKFDGDLFVIQFPKPHTIAR